MTMPGPRPRSSEAGAGSPRERLLRAAAELFYDRGINAVGVDAVVERAGVAKMSLYHHFGSKDNLIAEVLRTRSEDTFRRFVNAVDALAPEPAPPEARLLAVFDHLCEWVSEPDFRGCPFLNALAEIPARDHPAFEAAAGYFRKLHGLLADLAKRSGAREHEAMALQLATLVSGAIPWSVLHRSPEPARHARAAAGAIVESHLRGANADRPGTNT